MNLCSICTWLRKQVVIAIAKLIELCQPKKLVINTKGATSMDVIIGQTAPFTVDCLNAEGQVIPDTNGAIVASTADPSVATATCNADGSGGVVTGLVLGTTMLNATDSVLNAAPVVVNVIDPTPASLRINA